MRDGRPRLDKCKIEQHRAAQYLRLALEYAQDEGNGCSELELEFITGVSASIPLLELGVHP